MNCSVVMVSYNTGPALFASVKSVLRQDMLGELIIVNNGNPPDMVSRLQQMALTDARLKVVTGGGNIGYARGCNMGVSQATGAFVLLLSPSNLLPPDALKDMMKHFNAASGAMLAGSRVLSPDGSAYQGVRREFLTPKGALKLLLGIDRLKRGEHKPQTDNTHDAPVPAGGCLLMRRADYQRLGGMDERFFLQQVGELDLTLRTHLARGRVVCIAPVAATRMPGVSDVRTPAAEWQKAKGYIHYFRKHFTGQVVVGMLSLVIAAIFCRFVARSVANWFARRLEPRARVARTTPAKRLMILASGLAELPERKEWYGKTVLVTGATSQIGLCVVRRLIAQGAAVLAISRNDPIPFQHAHLRWIKGDLTDQKLHLDGYLVDMVAHCAPLWHLPPTIDLLAAAEVKRVIAFGSTSVFGKVMSRNPYEKEIVSKLIKAETETVLRCQAKDIQWTILRPTLIYGVGLDLSITSLIKIINRFGFFPVYPPAYGRRHPVHADDLALAVVQAASTSTSIGKSYNLSGGETILYREMLERLFTLLDRKPKIVETTLLPFMLDVAGRISGKRHINGEIARRMNDDLIFFHDDASRDFGFKPRPFLSGGMKDIEGY
jgi:nucleoside-diphosphate-sugar epimerase/GT2 family glycosyltransferase